MQYIRRKHKALQVVYIDCTAHCRCYSLEGAGEDPDARGVGVLLRLDAERFEEAGASLVVGRAMERGRPRERRGVSSTGVGVLNN